MITKSFEACGISVNTDGSQDSSIHCLKDTGVAAAAKPKIDELTKMLTEVNLDNDNDDGNPFDDLDSETNEDDDEEENNEIVVDEDSLSDENSSASESSGSEES